MGIVQNERYNKEFLNFSLLMKKLNEEFPQLKDLLKEEQKKVFKTANHIISKENPTLIEFNSY